MKKFSGFTLAEVLITLGIIGVVAAMTIPTLITEHQKRTTVTKLQKAISVINQAYRLSFEELGEPAKAFDLGSEEYFKTYWEPYIKVMTFSTDYKDFGYNSQAPFISPNGNNMGWSVALDTARATFYTMDGFLYVISVAEGYDTDGNLKEDKNNIIIVDINGSTKPNRLGRDVFILSRIQNGKGVQPYSYQGEDKDINESCSYSGTGWACAEKIRRSGWRIDKSYPWKG